MTGGTRGPDVPDEGENQVFGRDPALRQSGKVDLHGAGLDLHHTLGRQNVLHLARADAESEGTEGPVGGGMRVAADDGHARLGQPELGTDDVHDSLVGRIEVVQLDPELLGVPHQCGHLACRQLVGDRQPAVSGRHVVVHRGDGEVGPADAAPRQPESLERLGRGHLVHQVQIHVEQRRPSGELAHHVSIPDLLEEGTRHVFQTRRGDAGVARGRSETASAFPGEARLAPTAFPFPSSDHGIIARSSAPYSLDLVVLVRLAGALEVGAPGPVLRQPLPGERSDPGWPRGSAASRLGSRR